MSLIAFRRLFWVGFQIQRHILVARSVPDRTMVISSRRSTRFSSYRPNSSEKSEQFFFPSGWGFDRVGFSVAFDSAKSPLNTGHFAQGGFSLQKVDIYLGPHKVTYTGPIHFVLLRVACYEFWRASGTNFWPNRRWECRKMWVSVERGTLTRTWRDFAGLGFSF